MQSAGAADESRSTADGAAAVEIAAAASNGVAAGDGTAAATGDSAPAAYTSDAAAAAAAAKLPEVDVVAKLLIRFSAVRSVVGRDGSNITGGVGDAFLRLQIPFIESTTQLKVSRQQHHRRTRQHQKNNRQHSSHALNVL